VVHCRTREPLAQLFAVPAAVASPGVRRATFACPRTRTCRPPYGSLRVEFTRPPPGRRRWRTRPWRMWPAMRCAGASRARRSPSPASRRGLVPVTGTRPARRAWAPVSREWWAASMSPWRWSTRSAVIRDSGMVAWLSRGDAGAGTRLTGGPGPRRGVLTFQSLPGSEHLHRAWVALMPGPSRHGGWRPRSANDGRPVARIAPAA